MSKFEQSVERYYSLVLEADIPPTAAPAAPAASALPSSPDASLGGDSGGGMPPASDVGAAPSPPAEDMENEVKRKANPTEYTRTMLALLVDTKEGVTPEMFDDFVDSVSLGITKIKDKEGLKQFYGNFYKRLDAVLKLREELKSMFRQLTGTMDDLVGAESAPDAAGGGQGMAGPSGPGVQ